MALIAELSVCIDDLSSNGKVKAIVITGEGKCFAAGADIKEFTTAFGDREKGKQMASTAQTLFDKIERMDKPILCAINGACLGGGLELAMSCHMRIASEDAQLGLPELKLGLIPGYGGTQRLARLTNKAKALELMLISRIITGQEAERIGLVNLAVPANILMSTAIEWAEIIAGEKSALTTNAVLRAVDHGLNTSLKEGLVLESELFGELFASEDTREGIQAFIEKRKAIFQDR
jgi:enoyl-CoA hydratase